MMHLYRELGSGFYRNALDLVTVPVVDRIVHPPRAIHFTVVDMFLTAAVLDLLNDFLDVLNLVLVGDQNGVLCLYHDQIVDTHQCHQPAIGVNI